MNTTFASTYFMLTSQLNEMEENNKQWEERLKKQWEETKKMPRKMKKKRRKEILLDYSIQQLAKEFLFERNFNHI